MKVTLFGPDTNIENLSRLDLAALAVTNIYVKLACKKVLIINEPEIPRQPADFLETKFSIELCSLKCCTYRKPSIGHIRSAIMLDRV